MSKWWAPTEQEALEFELKDLLGDTEHFRLVVDIIHLTRESIDSQDYLKGWNDRDDEIEYDHDEELEEEYIRGWNDCIAEKKGEQ